MLGHRKHIQADTMTPVKRVTGTVMLEWLICHHNDAGNYLEDCLRFSRMKGLSCETFEANSFMPTSSCNQAVGDVAQG